MSLRYHYSQDELVALQNDSQTLYTEIARSFGFVLHELEANKLLPSKEVLLSRPHPYSVEFILDHYELDQAERLTLLPFFDPSGIQNTLKVPMTPEEVRRAIANKETLRPGTLIEFSDFSKDTSAFTYLYKLDEFETARILQRSATKWKRSELLSLPPAAWREHPLLFTCLKAEEINSAPLRALFIERIEESISSGSRHRIDMLRFHFKEEDRPLFERYLRHHAEDSWMGLKYEDLEKNGRLNDFYTPVEFAVEYSPLNLTALSVADISENKARIQKSIEAHFERKAEEEAIRYKHKRTSRRDRMYNFRDLGRMEASLEQFSALVDVPMIVPYLDSEWLDFSFDSDSHDKRKNFSHLCAVAIDTLASHPHLYDKAVSYGDLPTLFRVYDEYPTGTPTGDFIFNSVSKLLDPILKNPNSLYESFHYHRDAWANEKLSPGFSKVIMANPSVNGTLLMARTLGGYTKEKKENFDWKTLNSIIYPTSLAYWIGWSQIGKAERDYIKEHFSEVHNFAKKMLITGIEKGMLSEEDESNESPAKAKKNSITSEKRLTEEILNSKLYELIKSQGSSAYLDRTYSILPIDYKNSPAWSEKEISLYQSIDPKFLENLDSACDIFSPGSAFKIPKRWISGWASSDDPIDIRHFNASFAIYKKELLSDPDFCQILLKTQFNHLVPTQETPAEKLLEQYLQLHDTRHFAGEVEKALDDVRAHHAPYKNRHLKKSKARNMWDEQSVSELHPYITSLGDLEAIKKNASSIAKTIPQPVVEEEFNRALAAHDFYRVYSLHADRWDLPTGFTTARLTSFFKETPSDELLTHLHNDVHLRLILAESIGYEGKTPFSLAHFSAKQMEEFMLLMRYNDLPNDPNTRPHHYGRAPVEWFDILEHPETEAAKDTAKKCSQWCALRKIHDMEGHKFNSFFDQTQPPQREAFIGYAVEHLPLDVVHSYALSPYIKGERYYSKNSPPWINRAFTNDEITQVFDTLYAKDMKFLHYRDTNAKLDWLNSNFNNEPSSIAQFEALIEASKSRPILHLMLMHHSLIQSITEPKERSEFNSMDPKDPKDPKHNRDARVHHYINERFDSDTILKGVNELVMRIQAAQRAERSDRSHTDDDRSFNVKLAENLLNVAVWGSYFDYRDPVSHDTKYASLSSTEHTLQLAQTLYEKHPSYFLSLHVLGPLAPLPEKWGQMLARTDDPKMLEHLLFPEKGYNGPPLEGRYGDYYTEYICAFGNMCLQHQNEKQMQLLDWLSYIHPLISGKMDGEFLGKFSTFSEDASHLNPNTFRHTNTLSFIKKSEACQSHLNTTKEVMQLRKAVYSHAPTEDKVRKLRL